jgi:hypothetical protein
MRETEGSAKRKAAPPRGAGSSHDPARQPSIRSKSGIEEGAWEGVEFRLQFGPEQGRSDGGDQGVPAGWIADVEIGTPISNIRSESSR